MMQHVAAAERQLPPTRGQIFLNISISNNYHSFNALVLKRKYTYQHFILQMIPS